MHKISLILLFFLCFSNISAQKFYFTGIGIRGLKMTDRTTQTEKSNIIVSACSDPIVKQKAKFISDKLLFPKDKESATNNFLMFDIYLRPKKTNNFFRWSEWVIGLGYAPIRKNVSIYRPIYRYEGSTLYAMERIIGKQSAFMIESKFIINSSPYKSRLMKYFGLGFRASAINEANNAVKFTESLAGGTKAKMDSLLLSNTSNALLGLFAMGGIKYNLSCKFNVFMDINMGYCWRFYPEKVNTGGYNFSFSLGIKYKMGSGPLEPEDTKPAEEDEKSKKRSKKKMQVYW